MRDADLFCRTLGWGLLTFPRLRPPRAPVRGETIELGIDERPRLCSGVISSTGKSFVVGVLTAEFLQLMVSSFPGVIASVAPTDVEGVAGVCVPGVLTLDTDGGGAASPVASTAGADRK